MQPISMTSSKTIPIAQENNEYSPAMMEELNHAIEEVATRENILERTLGNMCSRTPTDSIVHEFNRVKERLHLALDNPTRESIVQLIQTALTDTHRELYRLQKEKEHRPFPLKNLSSELLGLVIEQSDSKTKGVMAQVSKGFSSATLWMTKIECKNLTLQIIQKLQEDLFLRAIHNVEATAKTIQALSEIDVDVIRREETFSGIHLSTRNVRNEIAKALFL